MSPDEVRNRLVPLPGTADCIGWPTVSVAAGYGRTVVNGVRKTIHVALWEDANGTVPEGRRLRHLCHDDDPTCEDGPECPHRRCGIVAHITYKSDTELADEAEAEADAALAMCNELAARPSLYARLRQLA